ncbi:hypothetical protein LINGRAHAP2_LOCUS20064 [Linum grandiflorum]
MMMICQKFGIIVKRTFQRSRRAFGIKIGSKTYSYRQEEHLGTEV